MHDDPDVGIAAEHVMNKRCSYEARTACSEIGSHCGGSFLWFFSCGKRAPQRGVLLVPFNQLFGKKNDNLFLAELLRTDALNITKLWIMLFQIVHAYSKQ